MKKLTLLLALALLIPLPLLRRAPDAKASGPASAASTHEKSVASHPHATATGPTGSPAGDALATSAATPAEAAPDSGLPSASPAASALPATPDHPFGGAPAAPSPDELPRHFASAATPADLLQMADLTDPAQRAFVVARLGEMNEERHDRVLAEAERLGIPVRIEGPGGKVSILHDFRDGRPLYRTTLNANAAISTGANLLRDSTAPYGLDGAGLRVGVWDEARVRTTHQEFAAGSRVAIKDSASTFSDHATHVAGTIGAAGVVASAKGMAPQIRIDSYDWSNDTSEMTAAGAATDTDAARIPLSNHSYGYEAFTSDMGRYDFETRNTDALAAALPFYSIFQAAGNEQDELTALGGYQSITYAGLAKNVITIGAGRDAVNGGSRSPAAGTLSSFSSMGPCDDGRIKPDLTANGVGLYSSVATGNTAYDTYDGTSMASPNALGSAALVQQLYAREFSGRHLRASLLKALLIQTADDLGPPGPDYQYGWGYLNAKAAADLVLAHKSSTASPKLIEGTLTNSAKTQTHSFSWDGVTPIRATLCWTDPAGVAQTAADSRTANLVHDLDLRITTPGGVTALPYVMPFVGTWTLASMSQNAVTGANHVDNVEQVRIATPSQPGNYTVTVSLTGSLTTASQIYSLVVSGGTVVEANPAPTVILTAPADGAIFLAGSPVTLSATAGDKAAGGGAGAVAKVEFFAGASSLGSVSAPPYTLVWTPPAPGAYSLSAVATDTVGAAARSASVSITVLSGDGRPDLTNLAPSSGAIGDSVTLTGRNFAAVSSVRVNGVSALFTVDSPTSIRAILPASATTGIVTVTTPYGTAASTDMFTVVRNPVLISQLYGGGALTGAPYNADYVELLNRGDTPVNLSGWSLQYATASGTSWQSVALTGTLQPGVYHLVQLAGGSVGASLPTPDVIGSLNISGTQGKLALRNIATAFTGSTPLGQSGLQDFVGYGSANSAKGSPAPAPSTANALFRAGGGASDTGDNSADFTTAPPNPRHSLAGPPPAPIISSSTAVTGEVGKPFSYQITAANTPTSFAASGLPFGLVVNTSTGLVSGTPGISGIHAITLSATNVSGTGVATLTLVVSSASTTVFTENMGSPSADTAIANHVFRNPGLSFSGTALARTVNPSSGYAGATGGGNVSFATSAGLYFEISGIDTRGHTDLALSFGHFKNTTASSNELAVSVSADGVSYTPLTYTRPTTTGTANTWLRIMPAGAIPAAQNLRIRFLQTISTAQFRLDDVVLTGRLPVPSFAEWAAGLSDPAPAADPDGDGMANLLEYFMALDPRVAEAPVRQPASSATVLRIDYRRSKALHGVDGGAEWTTSLAGTPAWSEVGVTDILVSDEGTHELRRASVPVAPGETAKFLRLRVTLP